METPEGRPRSGRLDQNARASPKRPAVPTAIVLLPFGPTFRPYISSLCSPTPSLVQASYTRYCRATTDTRTSAQCCTHNRHTARLPRRRPNSPPDDRPAVYLEDPSDPQTSKSVCPASPPVHPRATTRPQTRAQRCPAKSPRCARVHNIPDTVSQPVFSIAAIPIDSSIHFRLVVLVYMSYAAHVGSARASMRNDASIFVRSALAASSLWCPSRPR
ncbi:hypothetical protein C8Q77DRAFT_489411 [Trametes polyzona]|nr:hypothetical protein C8Q77DRAFT_489411 [Trametes polyzona]